MVQTTLSYSGVTASIVEFMEENEPQISWVLQEVNGKLKLLLPNRKEFTIPLSRVLPWAGPSYPSITSKDAAVSLLEKHKKKRLELIASYNPIELWELAEGEVTTVTATWLCELTTKNPDVDSIAACAHSLLRYKTHFKFRPPYFEVLSKEVVEKRILDQEKTLKYEYFIQQGSSFFKHLWGVYTKKHTLNIKQLEDIKSIEDELKQYLLDDIIYQKTKNDIIWKALTKGLPNDQYLAYHFAETWKIIEPNFNFLLKRVGYETDSSWGLAYQDTIEGLKYEQKNDEDCLLEKYISVDDETTKDIDDAFYIKEHHYGGWEVSVAIACPALAWPFDSQLDFVVRERATSVYLPEATYNMLPDILTHKYSLYANMVRPALIVKCIVNADGEIQDYDVSFNYVSLSANINYKDCEKIIEGIYDTPYSSQIQLAFQMAQACQKRRLKNGAVIINRIEPKIVLSYTDENVQVFLKEETLVPKAQLLVSEMMILANASLAQWAFKKDVPLIHRTQDIIIPNEYCGIWEEPCDTVKAMKNLMPSVLDVEAKPHAGLGELKYAPTTSPLRRYTDMVNEAQVLHYIQYGKAFFSKDMLQKMLEYISVRVEQVCQAQRYRIRYWKLMYMLQQNTDKWWTGVVVDIGDIFIGILLQKENITLRARTTLFKQTIQLGKIVHVYIDTIRPLYNETLITDVKET